MDNNYENITSNPDEHAVKHKKGFKNLKTWQKVTAIGALAAVIIGAGGVTAYYLLNNNNSSTISTTPVSSSTFSGQSTTELTLKDGKNEITSGGIYHVTGSTTAGWITIDTSAEVKLILDNVTIETSENQAIRSKQENSVLIEFVGQNTLTSSVPSSDDTKPAISIAGSLTIDGSGSATISSTGKGIKAVYALVIQNSTIDITKSYEGLEAADITITGGDISITASDDGINASSSAKNEATGESTATTGQGMMGGGGSMKGGIDVSDGSALTISGGKVYVNANGDGIDSNGNVTISGGEIYVDGPTSDGDGPMDYNGEMSITGGTLVAVGSSGMAQNATSSTQPSVLINLTSSQSGTITFGGVSYTPKKSYSSILISSPNLSVGSTYDLQINGATVQSVTITDNITGSGGMMGGGRGGMMMDRGGDSGGEMPDGQQGNRSGTPPSGTGRR